MDDGQINLLLTAYRKSQHYQLWRPRRMDRYKYNNEWINPAKVQDISNDDLQTKFMEYYKGGEGRQVLNQIWRDRIIRDTPKFRDVLLYLLDETIPVEERFSNVVSSSGDKHIDGVGKALASAFLMDFDLHKYCIWNNKTEMGFTVLGWEAPYVSSDSEGGKYVKVLQQLGRLRDDIGSRTNLDFDEIDNFLHWIAAEEEGKTAVMDIIGERALAEAGMAIEAPEERFVQQLIDRNFDNIFAPFNLTLYDGDPDQTGSQFNTPVGRIDFLAVDSNTNDIIVIELKVGKVTDSAIGQTLRYMGYVKSNLAKDHNVRGIILAEDIDDKAKYALSLVPTIECKIYKLNIQLAS
jgi:hypothetical protein